ncbi:MAG: hypothetical protein QMD71_09565 [bacterium]|nr:hypothetical protein [bacterium]
MLSISFVLESNLASDSVSVHPVDMRSYTKLLVLPDTIIGPPLAVGDTFIDSIYVSKVNNLY